MATREEISNKIIENAMHFVGLYEVQDNSKWESIVNPSKSKQLSDELTKLMIESGWQKGWPYCAAFCEAIYRKSYKELQAPESVQNDILSKLCPSVIQSFNNFKPLISKTPQPGSIFFMRKGKSSFGHAGIVCGIDGDTLATIEGNTSSPKKTTSVESDRNGDCITKKTRKLDFTVKSGLYLVGFLNPIIFE